jgi:hypothetical protein
MSVTLTVNEASVMKLNKKKEKRRSNEKKFIQHIYFHELEARKGRNLYYGYIRREHIDLITVDRT